jgi:ligand-binding sensor domain-containing protein
MRFVLIIFFIYCPATAQTNVELIKHLNGITVYDISADNNNIWAATNGNGIFALDKKKNKWTNYSTQNEKLQIDFFYALDVNDEYVWAGSTDGIFIFDKKRNQWMKRKFGKGGQLSNWIRSVKYDAINNCVWIGRFKYLTKYDIAKRRFIDYDLTTKGDEKTNTIKTIQVDGDSLVWFGTENGLHKYDKSRDLEEEGTITFYDNSLNFFRGEGDAVSISAILIEQNNVWIGLDEFITKINPEFNLGGVYKYNRRYEWKRFDERLGLEGNGVFDMALTGHYIWISLYQFSINSREVYGRGLALINRLTEEITTLDSSSLPNTVYSLYYDGKYLWMGARDGLYQLDLSSGFIGDFSKIKR